jgi:hypothetical protein
VQIVQGLGMGLGMSDEEGWGRRCTPPPGLVAPVAIDPTGRDGPTPGQARGPRWRKSSHGRYVPAAVDGTVPEQRILEQAARLSNGGAVTGWASGRLHGARYLDGLHLDGRTRLPVPLVAGPLHRLVATDGSTVSRDRIYSDEIVTRLGVPCAAPTRATFDAMRYAAGLWSAVIAFDMMATAGLVTLEEMTAYIAAHPAWRGVGQAREALKLVDENSWSPRESWLRLVWEVVAGFPHPLCNRPVFSLDGTFIGTPDLLDPVAGVAGEYDGADHLGRDRRARDVVREEGFRRVGLEYFEVTSGDVAHRSRVVERMTWTRSRALWLPEQQRQWTVDPPAWWLRRAG